MLLRLPIRRKQLRNTAVCDWKEVCYEMNNKKIRKARRFNFIQSKGNYWITCDIHCHSTNSTRVWLDDLMSHTPRVSRLHAVFGAYAPCRHGRTVVGKSTQLAGYGGTKVKLRWSAVWMLSWWSHRERWAEFQISWCYYRPRAFMSVNCFETPLFCRVFQSGRNATLSTVDS